MIRGERWIGGRLFVLYEVLDSKADAEAIADRLRRGEVTAAFGYRGPNYVRVVRHGWANLKWTASDGSAMDLNRYAVYTFPRTGDQ